MAGFITTASGQRMAFVQYLSGYAVPPEDHKQRRAPLVRFESRLYRDIYQNN
ncbi:D-alanyl-D-alanine carboxypeptidase [Pseudomonas aeruginosa]